MLISVIPIGNSKGIRIPKNIINELAIEDKLEMKVQDNKIILKPAGEKPRAGWEEIFSKMHLAKEDNLFIEEEFTDDSFEWDW